MKNVTMSYEGKTLVIKVDLTKNFGKSASGKSVIVASTEGNVSLEGHPEIKLGLNCYTKE